MQRTLTTSATRPPPSLRNSYIIVLVCGAVFLGWLGAFIANGLHHYSREAIAAQQTSVAASWPFSDQRTIVQTMILPAVVGMFVSLLALPVATLRIFTGTLARWDGLNRIERAWHLVGLVGVCLLMALLLWFAPSLMTWMLD